LWQRLLVDFIHWWWRVLRMWYLGMGQRWVEVVLVMRLLKRRLLPLFMVVKDLNGV
jgi:hypothetical protein